MPKLKKLRQWSQESLLSLNLSQLTRRGNNRNNNNNTNHKLNDNSNSYDDNVITIPKGISTISGAILDHKIDPKRDNFGLYALKCDRSSSLANAKRGILLTLPSAKLRTRAEINSYQSVVERTHEVFESCEKNQDDIIHDGATSNAKIEPPPRKKKRQTATHHLIVHQKVLKKPPAPPPTFAKDIKKAELNSIKKNSFDKIESGLYRIVNTQAVEKVEVSVENFIGNTMKEQVVTMVKPNVQKAIAVKVTPLPRQITNVKNIDSNKSVKNNPVNLNKVQPKQCYKASELGCSQQTSVDIFKPNHSVFDEFDAIFDKNQQVSGDLSTKKEASTFTAFQKLNELKFSSSSFSSESSYEEKQVEVDVIEPKKCSIRNIKTQNFYESNLPRIKYLNSSTKSIEKKSLEDSTKPRIISEQPKVLPTSYTTQKVIYYDDKNDILNYQQLILNQNQSTTIINNHFNDQTLSAGNKMIDNDKIDNNNNKLIKTDDKVPIKSILTTKLSSTSDAVSKDYDDEAVVSGNYEDLRNNNNNNNNNNHNFINNTSNSLRIFSNESVFVFNL